MRNFYFLLFTILCSFYTNIICAQNSNDTIVLLNGEIIIANVIDTTGGTTSIKNPHNPEKNIVIENDRIFSINNSKGEFLIYAYDSIVGNEFTVDEMRYFIRGERDAQKGFKARGAFWGSILLGTASGLSGSFLAPIVPFGFTALTALPKVKINKKYVSDPEYLTHDSYLMGYERVAQKKRKIKSLIGGGIGLGVGFGTYFILKANKTQLY